MKIEFECLKMALKQDKEGYVLTLRVHPNDIPDALLRAWVGTRYDATLLEVVEDSDKEYTSTQRPVRGTRGPSTTDRLIVASRRLCGISKFHKYLEAVGISESLPVSFEDASSDLKKYLGVRSREELADNDEARDKMGSIIGDFAEWDKENPGM